MAIVVDTCSLVMIAKNDLMLLICYKDVYRQDAIHLEEMQVMTEETRQQNDGKLKTQETSGCVSR